MRVGPLPVKDWIPDQVRNDAVLKSDSELTNRNCYPSNLRALEGRNPANISREAP